MVHCLAGKGRIGTLISYSGRCPDRSAALLYYKRKRFLNSGGVPEAVRRLLQANKHKIREESQSGAIGSIKLKRPHIMMQVLCEIICG